MNEKNYLVQVRHKGVWGTVCMDNFGEGEAQVFCRLLPDP